MTKYTKEEKQEAREYLMTLLKPGDVVYTVLKHVSRSGMSRVIDLYIMRDNQPVRISRVAAKLLEGYSEKYEGCKASGCGMDMGFHLVYNLSYALFPEWNCIQSSDKDCPDSSHFGDNWGKRSDTPHQSGYALVHRWM